MSAGLLRPAYTPYTVEPRLPPHGPLVPRSANRCPEEFEQGMQVESCNDALAGARSDLRRTASDLPGTFHG
jgi:hypothetical protein